MGATHNAIPVRLDRGEEIDVVIMAAPRLDDLIKEGKVRQEGRVDLVRSTIAMAVKAGAPKPDINTPKALRRTLLAAKSIACSDSDSGVYLITELFPKLGIADRIKDKVIKIEATPAGEAVASGGAEIGFQQISELLPVKTYHRKTAAARSTAGHLLCGGYPGNRKESGGRQEAHSTL